MNYVHQTKSEYCTLNLLASLLSFIQIFIHKGFKKKVSVKIIKNENKRVNRIVEIETIRERETERERKREIERESEKERER